MIFKFCCSVTGISLPFIRNLPFFQRGGGALIFCLFCTFTHAHTHSTEIIFWHALAGPLGEEVNHLAKQFNQSHPNYVIKPIYKGSYLETLTAYAAAFRAGKPPPLVQVFEIGKWSMLHPQGVIKPVAQVLSEQDRKWSQDKIWPALLSYYTYKNELSAFPFNASVPVMYYNKNKLNQLGIDMKRVPHTWQAFSQVLQALHDSGESCGYTSAYPSWIHIESFQSLNSPSKQKGNLLKSHLERLLFWQKKHDFEYAGRHDEGTILFTSGKCAFFTQSSGAYQSLASVASFQVGVLPMPSDDRAQRQANVVGGGAIWVSAGLDPHVEQGIAQWFHFLLQPDTQAHWSQRTGYLPILKQDTHTGMLSLVNQEWGTPRPAEGHPSWAQNRIRAMNDESLESLFSGLLNIKQIMTQLENSAAYANYRFDKNHNA